MTSAPSFPGFDEIDKTKTPSTQLEYFFSRIAASSY